MTGDEPQKVLLVCPNLKGGGAERQWAILAPGLVDRGFHVAVLTLDGCGIYFDELRGHGVPIACARLRHRLDPIGLARALHLGRWPSDAVMTRGVSAHLVGHVVARTQHAAHIVTEHLGPDPLRTRPLRLHQQLLLAPMRPRVTAVVAVAASQREHLVRDGYDRDAIRVIANGVAGDPPVRDREAVRAELGVHSNAFLAVLVAALRLEKRASLFVEQVTAAHAVEPSVQGLVVGEGPDGASVERAACRSGGVVRMVGFRPDVLDVMHAADVVCLTSAVEALPMSVLEAMSVGRPVIATRVGGVPEVVVDDETGILISPENSSEMVAALVALARDTTRADELGREGRVRQQRLFSIEAMTRRYAELLTDLGRVNGSRLDARRSQAGAAPAR